MGAHPEDVAGAAGRIVAQLEELVGRANQTLSSDETFTVFAAIENSLVEALKRPVAGLKRHGEIAQIRPTSRTPGIQGSSAYSSATT